MKKIGIAGISIAMILVLVSIFYQKDTSIQEEEIQITKKTMMFAEPGLESIDHGSNGYWEKIYYGDVLWRILNPQETKYKDIETMLLLSDTIYPEDIFDASDTNYIHSELRMRIQDIAKEALTDKEQSYIVPITQKGGQETIIGPLTYVEPELTEDLFFAPTAQMLNNSDYGFASNANRESEVYYWLSSHQKGESKKSNYISRCGVFATIDKDVGAISTRVVTNINAQEILFIKEVNVDKEVKKLQALQEIKEKTPTGIYKLTMKDPNQTITIDSIVQKDNEVSFNYATTGDGNRLSVIISKDTDILYYGQLVDISTNKQGKTQVIIPKEIDLQTCQVSVFSEVYQNTQETGFASALVPLKIEK